VKISALFSKYPELSSFSSLPRNTPARDLRRQFRSNCLRWLKPGDTKTIKDILKNKSSDDLSLIQQTGIRVERQRKNQRKRLLPNQAGYIMIQDKGKDQLLQHSVVAQDIAYNQSFVLSTSTAPPFLSSVPLSENKLTLQNVEEKDAINSIHDIASILPSITQSSQLSQLSLDQVCTEQKKLLQSEKVSSSFGKSDDDGGDSNSDDGGDKKQEINEQNKFVEKWNVYRTMHL